MNTVPYAVYYSTEFTEFKLKPEIKCAQISSWIY